MIQYSLFTYRYSFDPIAFIEKGCACCAELINPLGHKSSVYYPG